MHRAPLEEGCLWLDRAVLGPLDGSVDGRGNYLALLPTEQIITALGTRWASDAFDCAERLELFGLRVYLSADPALYPTQKPPPNLPLPVELESMTLGHRRALARRAQGIEFERLLADTDPVVISRLLDNPRCTESAVLKIASRRPQHPDILQRIGAHPHFGPRPKVLRALVHNAALPFASALALLPLLGRRQLDQMAKDPAIDEDLRDGARLLSLAARRGPSQDPRENAQPLEQ